MVLVPSALLLKISAIISLVFAAGNTAGGLKQWSPMGPNDVLRSMTDVRFHTMGATRSYLDFFVGFGWSISVAGFLQTFVLWQMANIANTDAALIRPMTAAYAVATLVSGVISWRLFFRRRHCSVSRYLFRFVWRISRRIKTNVTGAGELFR